MKKSKKFLEKISKEKSKREYHKKYNYLKLQEIRKNLIEKLEKSKEEYQEKLKYNDKILEKSNLYKIEDIEILEIEKYYILIRKDEKSFFFNNFIIEINDYNNNQKVENKKSLIDYMKNISNFLILENENIIILDTENDYILK